MLACQHDFDWVVHPEEKSLNMLRSLELDNGLYIILLSS